MQVLHATFGIFYFILFLGFSIQAQDLVYPEEVEAHYQVLLESGPKNAVLQEWWRKKGYKTLNKGASFSYDGKGRLAEIITGNGISWTYTYRSDSRPKYIVIDSGTGIDTIFYQYQKEFCARLFGASHAAEARSYQYYFYDDAGRIVEEKGFITNKAPDGVISPELSTRIVRTFKGPTDERVKGEMFYNHFFLPTDGKVYQHKTVFQYSPITKKLVEVNSYTEKKTDAKQPIPAHEFKKTKWVKYNEYDETGQLLIRQTHHSAIDGPLISERVFSYDVAGEISEINYTGYFSDQTIAKHKRQVFENGVLKSYYFEGTEPGTSYQASFVISL